MKKTFFLCMFLLLNLAISFAQVNESYYISSKLYKMRSGAGLDTKIIDTLFQKDVVRILKINSNGWWKVDFNGVEGFVQSSFLKKQSLEGWLPKKYQNGDQVGCDSQTNEFDLTLDNHLKVMVNGSSDVIIKLMQIRENSDVCIRTVFINSYDFTLIKNIPQGKYYLKIASGTDWREKTINGKCYGLFVNNAHYKIGVQKLNYSIIQLSNKIDIPSYSLSIGNKVVEGTESSFKSNFISSDKFNQ